MTMRIPARGIRALWQQWINSHGLQKPCGEKGTAQPLSQSERWPQRPSLGFYCFSRHIITSRMVLTMHRFVLGGYILQKTKERMLLITSKKKDICKCKGKSGGTGYTPYFGGLAPTLGS